MKFTEFRELKIKYDESNIIKFKEKNVIKVEDKRTKLNKDGLYEVYPLALHRNQVYIICPYCNEIHLHGCAEGSIPGFRNPFCTSDKPIKKKTYYIKEVNAHV